MERIKFQMDTSNLDLFAQVARSLYPYDEWQIDEVRSRWSWRYFNWCPTAIITKRDKPISQRIADGASGLLERGESVFLVVNPKVTTILQQKYGDLLEVEDKGNCIQLKLKNHGQD